MKSAFYQIRSENSNSMKPIELIRSIVFDHLIKIKECSLLFICIKLSAIVRLHFKLLTLLLFLILYNHANPACASHYAISQSKAMENVNLEVHNNGKLQNKYYIHVCFETRPCRFYWFLHSQLRNCFTCI